MPIWASPLGCMPLKTRFLTPVVDSPLIDLLTL